jgi:SH3 domain protein
VLTRFLSDTPAARDRLAAAQRRAARLEEANAELKQELVQALDGSEELGRLKQDLVAENESLRNEVAEIREASANAVRISEENREFRQRLLALQSESEQLRHENKALKSRREGMKVGALVLAAGILIGLILPLFRGRRRSSSWDSL